MNFLTTSLSVQFLCDKVIVTLIKRDESIVENFFDILIRWRVSVCLCMCVCMRVCVSICITFVCLHEDLTSMSVCASGRGCIVSNSTWVPAGRTVCQCLASSPYIQVTAFIRGSCAQVATWLLCRMVSPSAVDVHTDLALLTTNAYLYIHKLVHTFKCSKPL